MNQVFVSTGAQSAESRIGARRQRVLRFLILLLLLTYTSPFVPLYVQRGVAVDLQELPAARILTYAALCVAALSIAAGALYLGQVVKRLRSVAVLLSFAGFAMLSVIWSVNPWITFRESIDLFAFVCAAALLINGTESQVIARMVMRYVAFLIVASVVIVIVDPTDSIHHSAGLYGDWKGIFIHKNLLGGVSAICLILFVMYPRVAFKGRLIGWGIVGLSGLSLIGSHSTTSLFAALVTIPIWIFLRAVRPTLGVAILCVLLVVPLGIATYMFFIGDILASFGKDITFTGRTLIWSVVWHFIVESPVIGHGFVAASQVLVKPILIGRFGSSAVDSHNAYLDVLLGLGAVGLALLVGVLVNAIARVLEGLRDAGRSSRAGTDVFGAIVLFGIFHGVMEVGMFSPGGALSPFLYLSLVVVLSAERRTDPHGSWSEPERWSTGDLAP